MSTISGVAAKVPFIAKPPVSGWEGAPIVVVWHMLDAPRTEVAMAAALPLNDLDAWRVYLRLPVPEDAGDPVLGFYGPIVERAVADFPHALDELHRQIPAGRQPLRMVGGSLGAMVVSCLVAECDDIPVASAALVSPAVQLASLVTVGERTFGVRYPWSDESRRLAAQLDLVARAEEIAKRDVPVLLVMGDKDDDEFRVSAERMWQALSSAGEPGRYSLITVPGMGHALAEEPGIDAAPQTARAARVDTIVAQWLNRWATT
ncbi:MAG TPA: prolyl oligopeptidase family serine peptidase [Candidatus Limnocylindrales bacterium]|nr:prolyl oligopeptidase family serine peptidase [Candidatus Limnocylindrales bacterium]